MGLGVEERPAKQNSRLEDRKLRYSSIVIRYKLAIKRMIEKKNMGISE
jgi:hypothetical protein